MFIENVITSDTRLSLIRSALNQLDDANAFGALLEIGMRRSEMSKTTETPLETAAINGAWFDGYKECVNDLYYFFERYVEKGKIIQQEAQFGAPEKLYADGEITDEEYRELTGRDPAKRE